MNLSRFNISESENEDFDSMVTVLESAKPSPPDCPSCGRPMVYHSNLHRYQCHPCAIAEREKIEAEETVPLPWWMWLIAIIFMIIIILGLVFGPYATDTKGDPTQSEGTVDVVASHWSAIGYLAVLVGAFIIFYLIKNRKERCPKCGKVLKQTPNGHYYCMNCRIMYDPEDIEVEVVD